MQQATEVQPAKFGLMGFMLGIVSLVVILIQLSVFFEPQEQNAGTTIGEIAAEINSQRPVCCRVNPRLRRNLCRDIMRGSSQFRRFARAGSRRYLAVSGYTEMNPTGCPIWR